MPADHPARIQRTIGHSEPPMTTDIVTKNSLGSINKYIWTNDILKSKIQCGAVHVDTQILSHIFIEKIGKLDYLMVLIVLLNYSSPIFLFRCKCIHTTIVNTL